MARGKATFAKKALKFAKKYGAQAGAAAVDGIGWTAGAGLAAGAGTLAYRAYRRRIRAIEARGARQAQARGRALRGGSFAG